MFNDLRLFQRLNEGGFTQAVTWESHSAPARIGEPYCTYSQIAFYYDPLGSPAAVVHQYRRPDGSLGASGLPDPKRVFLADRIISVNPKQLT